MSSMAKIFVVVNLVIIVAVFGSAATLLGAQDDYRAALTEATTKARETHAAQKKRIDDAQAQTAAQQTKAINEMNRANDAQQRFEMAKASLDAANQITVSNGAALEGLSGEYGSLRKLYEGQAELNKTLHSYLTDVTERVIATAIHGDVSEPEVRSKPRELECGSVVGDRLLFPVRQAVDDARVLLGLGAARADLYIMNKETL